MKNMINNTMYTVQELHAYASNGIAFIIIVLNEIPSNEIEPNGNTSKVSL